MRIAQRMHDSSKKDPAKDLELKKETEAARQKWMASSSSEDLPVYGGWESTAFEHSAIPENDESINFLEKIKNIRGKTIKDIVDLIPAHATGEVARYNGPNLDWQGFMFAWKSPQSEQWKVLVHAPDNNAHITLDGNPVNTVHHWTVRVQRDNNYMDASGKFHSSRQANPGLHGVEEIINNTHIPIQTPESPYKNPVTQPDNDTPWGQEQLRRMRGR